MTFLLLLLLFKSILFAPVLADLTDAQVAVVKQRLAESAQRRCLPCIYLQTFCLIQYCSWELGTRAQALLELDSARYSVTTPGEKLPPSNSNPPSSLNDVFAIAQSVVSELHPTGNAPEPFIADDDTAGDPPSVGVAIILANWTNQQSSNGQNYTQAIRNQFNYLYTVPRTSDGAISHRTNQLQLW